MNGATKRGRTRAEQMHARILRLVPGIKDREPGWACRLQAPGFMDLHVDVLERIQYHDELRLRIALGHYFTQNGDRMADPDMEILLVWSPSMCYVEALHYQLDSVGVYWPSYNGQVPTRHHGANQAFLGQWLMNLGNQGHRPGMPAPV